MIHPAVEAKRAELADLCRRFGVRRLELFGSAASSRFRPGQSDLDFLVEFDPDQPGSLADRYFELLWALEALFARPIDLLMPSAITNPYLMKSIAASRELLYAA